MFFAQRRLLLPLLLLLPFCLLFLAGTLGQCCCCCEGCCCLDLGPCGPCDGSFFPAAFPAGLGLGLYGLYGRKRRQIIGRRTLSERSAGLPHPLPEPRPVADWLGWFVEHFLEGNGHKLQSFFFSREEEPVAAAGNGWPCGRGKWKKAEGREEGKMTR